MSANCNNSNELILKALYASPLVHKWFARRRPDSVVSAFQAFEEFIRDRASVIVDPFAGAGTFCLAALAKGYDVLACDINPVAWAIATTTSSPPDLSDFMIAVDAISKETQGLIEPLFTTRDNSSAIVPLITSFYLRTFECSCGNKIDLYNSPTLVFYKRNRLVFCPSCGELSEHGENKYTFSCPSCSHKFTVEGSVSYGKFMCKECRTDWKVVEALGSQEMPSYRMIAVESLGQSGKRQYHKATTYDYERAEEARDAIESLEIARSLLKTMIPLYSRNDKRPVSHGLRSYGDLFFPRQLYGLSILAQKVREFQGSNETKLGLALLVSETARANCRLAVYDARFRKLTPALSIHAYYVPTRPVEGNLWGTRIGRGSFHSNIRKMYRAYEKLSTALVNTKPKKASIHFTDAIDLPLNSLDNKFAIFTDPPYYDNLEYGYLADFSYQWLRICLTDFLEFQDAHPWNPNDLSLIASTTLNETKGESQIFDERLGIILERIASYGECQGIAIHYHHKKSEAWMALLRALYHARLVVSDLKFFKSELNNGFHTEKNSIKIDAVFFCSRKQGSSQHRVRPLSHFILKLEGELDRDLSEAELSTIRYASVVAWLSHKIDDNSLNNLDLLFTKKLQDFISLNGGSGNEFQAKNGEWGN